jgi:hypothetical protein
MAEAWNGKIGEAWSAWVDRRPAGQGKPYDHSICILGKRDDNPTMSSRETVIDFVSKLPEEMSLAQIAREIELPADIQTAREQAVRGEGIAPEDAHKLAVAWASK